MYVAMVPDYSKLHVTGLKCQRHLCSVAFVAFNLP